MNWFETNFDKILISLLLLIFACLSYYGNHSGPDSQFTNWATTTASNLSGALITLITGRLFRSSDKNGNGGTNVTTSTTISPTPVATVVATGAAAGSV